MIRAGLYISPTCIGLRTHSFEAGQDPSGRETGVDLSQQLLTIRLGLAKLHGVNEQ